MKFLNLYLALLRINHGKVIGANRPIPQAYEFGCTQIQVEGIPENLTPVLYEKKYSTLQVNEVQG